MSGLSEYISASTELLTAENYNELDAAVFAKLSYFGFENIYSSAEDSGSYDFYCSEAISLSAFAQGLLDAGQYKDSEEQEFLERLANSARYANCTVSDLAASSQNTQWAALTVDLGDNTDTAVIAMRGTDGSTCGWEEDFQLLYDTDGTNAQLLSRDYLESSAAGSILLAGHSKGGNNVTSAYLMASEETRSRVLHIDNFDGPGINDTLRDAYAEAYAELADKLDNYYPQDSIIGLLLNDNPGNSYFIYSDTGKGIQGILWEHDLLNFQTDGNGFVESEQSTLSDFVNRVLDGTVNSLSQAERVRLYQVLVKFGIPALIAQSGDSPFDDNSGWLESVAEAAAIYITLPYAEKAAAEHTAAALIVYAKVAGMELAAEKAKEKIEEVAGTVKSACNTAAAWIAQKSQELADGLLSFSAGVTAGIVSIAAGVTEWIGSLSGKKSKTSYAEVERIAVDFGVLYAAASGMEQAGRKLNGYYSRVGFLQSQLGIGLSYLCYSSFRTIKKNLSAAADLSANSGKALGNIAAAYRNTEYRLAAVDN